jgi:cutinase
VIGVGRIVAVLVAIFAMHIGWLGLAAAGASTAPKCAKVLAIGVRGSGETSADAGGIGKMNAIAITRFRQLVRSGVDVQPIDYPSLSVTVALSSPARYYAGAKVGVAALDQTLQHQIAACPREPITVFGYSQGAMVVNVALGALSTEQPGLLSRIAAVELIADPQRLGSASYVWGSAPHQFNGLGVYATSLALPGVGFPVRDLPAQIQSRSRSFCVTGDVVCGWDPTTPISQKTAPASLAAEGRAHASYATNGYARNAGTHAALTLKRFNIKST